MQPFPRRPWLNRRRPSPRDSRQPRHACSTRRTCSKHALGETKDKLGSRGEGVRMSSFGFDVHALREKVLGELHARPFAPLGSPARVIHFAFVTGAEAATEDRRALAEF